MRKLRMVIEALLEAKENENIVMAAWVSKYKTDMFLIDDLDLVIQQLEKII